MTKNATKDSIVAYRLNSNHYALLQQRAEERGYRNGNAMARATVIRELDSAHCLSHLVRQNHQGIITNRDMIMDLATAMLTVFEADFDKAHAVFSELSKYH